MACRISAGNWTSSVGGRTTVGTAFVAAQNTHFFSSFSGRHRPSRPSAMRSRGCSLRHSRQSPQALHSHQSCVWAVSADSLALGKGHLLSTTVPGSRRGTEMFIILNVFRLSSTILSRKSFGDKLGPAIHSTWQGSKDKNKTLATDGQGNLNQYNPACFQMLQTRWLAPSGVFLPVRQV